eukprot:4622088-Prymnesium_polylepis.1
MPVPQSVCVRHAGATRGYGDRHANRACVRRRANDRATHDCYASYSISHAGRASLCVLLPRPRPADLAARCGIPKTRDNEGVSQKSLFLCVIRFA